MLDDPVCAFATLKYKTLKISKTLVDEVYDNKAPPVEDYGFKDTNDFWRTVAEHEIKEKAYLKTYPDKTLLDFHEHLKSAKDSSQPRLLNYAEAIMMKQLDSIRISMNDHLWADIIDILRENDKSADELFAELNKKGYSLKDIKVALLNMEKAELIKVEEKKYVYLLGTNYYSDEELIKKYFNKVDFLTKLRVIEEERQVSSAYSNVYLTNLYLPIWILHELLKRNYPIRDEMMYLNDSIYNYRYKSMGRRPVDKYVREKLGDIETILMEWSKKAEGKEIRKFSADVIEELIKHIKSAKEGKQKLYVLHKTYGWGQVEPENIQVLPSGDVELNVEFDCLGPDKRIKLSVKWALPGTFEVYDANKEPLISFKEVPIHKEEVLIPKEEVLISKEEVPIPKKEVKVTVPRVRKKPFARIPKLLEQHSDKLQGLNDKQAAETMGVSPGSLSKYFKDHPDDRERYGIVKGKGGRKSLSRTAKLLEQYGRQLQGFNINEAAKKIGVSQSTLSEFLTKNPEYVDKCGIVPGIKGRPPGRIPKLLEQHGDKLQGLNDKQAAEVMGVSPGSLYKYFKGHPNDRELYGIVKGKPVRPPRLITAEQGEEFRSLFYDPDSSIEDLWKCLKKLLPTHINSLKKRVREYEYMGEVVKQDRLELTKELKKL